MEQLAEGASDPGQLLVSPKSPELAPVMAILEMFSVAFPVFLSVTFIGALVVPTGWAGEVRLVGDSVTAGCPVVLSNTVT